MKGTGVIVLIKSDTPWAIFRAAFKSLSDSLFIDVGIDDKR